ncbi:sensor histidine kinase [Nonomuraea sp. NPDC059194]|uniref:sensor histidine kinase n=1 Tax=Nonomuraea sp. NPDC059194 TaxID=3346764 RepID=UPI0036C53C4B
MPRIAAVLRWARMATLATLSMTVMAGFVMPGIGLFREPDPLRVALGAVGITLFAAAQAAVLYAAITPSARGRVQRWVFAAATVVSIPLAGPLAAPAWETWAWIGGAVLATAPLVTTGRWPSLAIMCAATAASAGVALWVGDQVRLYVVITLLLGLSTLAISGLHVWLWNLLLEAQEGRAAQARLAAAEERLRFARDVHDLLGHDLSVIALKAELAERLVAVAPERAAEEAADLRRLAATALTDLRAAVHGYREVDLPAQLTAVAQVLRSSGVRCTITGLTDGLIDNPGGTTEGGTGARAEGGVGGGLTQEVAAQLAVVLREASTNVLRHSTASWCTIELARESGRVRMTVTNDGAKPAAPDRHSSGLRGLRERLAEAGGTLRSGVEGDVFRLEVTL